jgi:hypothetical protein
MSVRLDVAQAKTRTGTEVYRLVLSFPFTYMTLGELGIAARGQLVFRLME